MADRLVVMDRGRVRQIGTPEELYERPADIFVASFLGRCNVFRGALEAPGQFRAGGMLLPCGGERPAGGAALVVRPERIDIATDAGCLPGRVTMVTYLGGMTEFHLDTPAGQVLVTKPTPAHGDPLRSLIAGDSVFLDWHNSFGRLLGIEPEGDQP